MDFTLTFLKLFFLGLWLMGPVLFSLILVIVLIGQIVGRRETWRRSDALYWCFITATTVGYGDFRPSKGLSKALSVVIALTGLVFTGIVVSIAIYAASHAFSKHVDSPEVRSTIEEIKR